MFPSLVDNNANNIYENMGLSNSEISSAQSHTNSQHGTTIDPPRILIPSDIIRASKVADPHIDIPEYVDLSEAKVMLKPSVGKILFGQQMIGLIPQDARDLFYWTLVDTDNNKMQQDLLREC